MQLSESDIKNSPNKNLGYIENFLYVIDKNVSDKDFRVNPKIGLAIEIIFIFHAEYELNCSTAVIRHMTSFQADFYSLLACVVTALYLPCHSRANEAVLRVLE